MTNCDYNQFPVTENQRLDSPSLSHTHHTQRLDSPSLGHTHQGLYPVHCQESYHGGQASPPRGHSSPARPSPAQTSLAPFTVSPDHGMDYDNVMVWLNQQSLGGKHSAKRRRRINRNQRVAANMRERRRMLSINSAFSELRKQIPIFPHEKQLSRIQTLRLAADYIGFMTEIVHGKDGDRNQNQNPRSTDSQQGGQTHAQLHYW